MFLGMSKDNDDNIDCDNNEDTTADESRYCEPVEVVNADDGTDWIVLFGAFQNIFVKSQNDNCSEN